MPIPCFIEDYNHHMGGGDIADQLRSYYDTELIPFAPGGQCFLGT